MSVRVGFFPSVVVAAAAAGFFTGCAANRTAFVGAYVQPATASEARPAVTSAEVLARARERIGAQDFAGALTVVRTLPGEDRATVLRQLVDETLQRDPVHASQLALAIPYGNAQAEALARATRARLAREPDATIAWALDLEDSSARLIAVDTLATEFAAHDARSALEKIRALPERPRRTDMLRLTAARWARQDPDAAIAWAEGLPGETRSGVMTSIVFELAQTRPARAASLVSSLPEGRERAFVFTSIGRTWVALEPAAAEAWLRSLPAGPMHDAALSGIASATGTIGPRRVGTGVDGRPRNRAVAMRPGGGGQPVDVMSLPPGPGRDAALESEFGARLQEAPARAAAWLALLPAGDLTDERLRRLAREWLRQDPASAQTWFELNVSSPPRREQILQDARP